MKRKIFAVLMSLVVAFSFVGCGEEEVEEEREIKELSPLSTLEETHTIEDFQFITSYDTGDYNLKRWRITDSKVIEMEAKVKNVPKGAEVLIEHVHIDMSLKSKLAQLDGLTQDSMDDSYHGTSQDGFLVSERYSYQNKFAIEGFSKNLISGWEFVCGDYGSGSIDETRLTEKHLIEDGKVYANKMQVVYDILIKYENEKSYHVTSVLDEFLIPVTK